ncbi:MAG: GGDEF domain-containing protein, partial [Pseudomonadota bacterium]
AARDPLESALVRALEAPWPRLIVLARISLAELAEGEARYDVAVEHLNLALQDAQAQQEQYRVVELYTRLARVLAKAGQPTPALEALEARVALEQELFDVRRTAVLAALQSEVEFERQAQRLETVEREEAIARLKLEQEATQRFIWAGTVLVLCALSFLVYGRLAAQRQAERLRAEVAEKTSALRERHAELERAYAAVDRASLTDTMTGLANRRFLERHIEVDAARALRLHEDARLNREAPANADLVFFLVDLDHFKTINDERGHAAGDAVLVEVSRRLERVFRQGDFVVRWGGEEFLLVARFVNREGAAAIAERIRRAVADTPFSLTEGSVSCTCSIGFSAYPLQADRPAACAWEEVVALADQALYTVKRGARDGWVGYLTARDVPPTTPIAKWVPHVVSGGAIEAVVSEGVRLGEAEPDASS